MRALLSGQAEINVQASLSLQYTISGVTLFESPVDHYVDNSTSPLHYRLRDHHLQGKCEVAHDNPRLQQKVQPKFKHVGSSYPTPTMPIPNPMPI
jgi:hypothetical protein